MHFHWLSGHSLAEKHIKSRGQLLGSIQEGGRINSSFQSNQIAAQAQPNSSNGRDVVGDLMSEWQRLSCYSSSNHLHRHNECINLIAWWKYSDPCFAGRRRFRVFIAVLRGPSRLLVVRISVALEIATSIAVSFLLYSCIELGSLWLVNILTSICRP